MWVCEVRAGANVRNGRRGCCAKRWCHGRDLGKTARGHGARLCAVSAGGCIFLCGCGCVSLPLCGDCLRDMDAHELAFGWKALRTRNGNGNYIIGIRRSRLRWQWIRNVCEWAGGEVCYRPFLYIPVGCVWACSSIGAHILLIELRRRWILPILYGPHYVCVFSESNVYCVLCLSFIHL